MNDVSMVWCSTRDQGVLRSNTNDFVNVRLSGETMKAAGLAGFLASGSYMSHTWSKCVTSRGL